MMLLLPLLFVIFIINFPAGSILYWITTNTWTMGQQRVIRQTDRAGGARRQHRPGAGLPPSAAATRLSDRSFEIADTRWHGRGWI